MADSTPGTFIHQTAFVEQGARLGPGIRVGPFCHVGAEVELGAGVELLSHVSVTGATRIGDGTRVFPHAALGGAPQDYKYKGERTTLEIGRNCVLRENFTAHIGTPTGRGHTRIGDNCMLMVGSHVAHDCLIGDNVIMANGSVLAGHCEVGDNVVISGLVAVHQFVRIGRGAMLAGAAGVAGDVIPYGMAQGDRAKLRGLNVIGLRRSGATHEDVRLLRLAMRMLFDRARPVAENVEPTRTAYGDNPRVAEMLDFIASRGKRIFCVPPLGRLAEDEEG